MALYSACEVVIGEEDLANCPCPLSDVTAGMTNIEETAFIEALLETASDALARVTHLPVGRCETVYRPCLGQCHYFGCPCGCAPYGIPLPGLDPVVTEVKIDGVELTHETDYVTISDGGRKSLERVTEAGNMGTWPNVQNVVAPDTQSNTFSITVESGTYVDYIMKSAAAEIACDILSELSNSRRTEEGAVSASGYGLTLSYFRFGDPTDQTTLNLIGLSWVRRWVASVGAVRIGGLASNDLNRGWKLLTRE